MKMEEALQPFQTAGLRASKHSASTQVCQASYPAQQGQGQRTRAGQTGGKEDVRAGGVGRQAWRPRRPRAPVSRPENFLIPPVGAWSQALFPLFLSLFLAPKRYRGFSPVERCHLSCWHQDGIAVVRPPSAVHLFV